MMNRFPLRQLGRTELKVGVLGMGGAPLGDLYERIPEERAQATLETAYARGLRLFDTAPLYGYGLSEHRFGHALRLARLNRRESARWLLGWQASPPVQRDR